MTNVTPALEALAKSYGVQTTYNDDQGKLVTVSTDALLTVLRVAGAALDRVEGAADALRAREQTIWRRVIEPVHVAPD